MRTISIVLMSLFLFSCGDSSKSPSTNNYSQKTETKPKETKPKRKTDRDKIAEFKAQEFKGLRSEAATLFTDALRLEDPTKEQMLEAMQGGYIPPYLTNRRAPDELPQPQWFTVNGKSYPDTPYLFIKEGENIRVRLINAGTENHHLHLHGHDFWMVADDGVPIQHPWQRNTVPLSPGKTYDIIIQGKNRGIWTFHDHDTRRVTNNGLYPGGNLLALVYEDLPEDEKLIMKYSGNTMFKKMEGMEGMSMKDDQTDMKKMMFGGDKLPKIALDE